MLLRRGLLLWGALVEGTVDACGTEGVTVSRAEELVLGCARARQPGARLQDVFCVTRQVELIQTYDGMTHFLWQNWSWGLVGMDEKLPCARWLTRRKWVKIFRLGLVSIYCAARLCTSYQSFLVHTPSTIVTLRSTISDRLRQSLRASNHPQAPLPMLAHHRYACLALGPQMTLHRDIMLANVRNASMSNQAHHCKSG